MQRGPKAGTLSPVMERDVTESTFTSSCFVVLWPFVFVTTDAVDEYIGPEGAW
jgi:hypothetical protein